MSGIKETKPLAEIDPEMFELVAAAKRRAPWRQTRAAHLGAHRQAWCHGKAIPLPIVLLLHLTSFRNQNERQVAKAQT